MLFNTKYIASLFFLLTSWHALALEIQAKDDNIYILNNNGTRDLVFKASEDNSELISYHIDQISNSGEWAILYSIHAGYGSRASETYFLYNVKHRISLEGDDYLPYSTLSGLEEFSITKNGKEDVLKLTNDDEILLSELDLDAPESLDLDQFRLNVSENLFTLDISYINNQGEYILDMDDSAGKGEMLGKVDMHIMMKHMESGEQYTKKVYSINNPSGLLDDNDLKLDEDGNYTIYRGSGKRAIFFPNSLAKGQYEFQVFLQLLNGEKIYSNIIDVNLPLN